MSALVVKRYKLRDAVRKHPELLKELYEAREQGASWSQLALIVYERTGLSVDPTTVRKWLTETQHEN